MCREMAAPSKKYVWVYVTVIATTGLAVFWRYNTLAIAHAQLFAHRGYTATAIPTDMPSILSGEPKQYPSVHTSSKCTNPDRLATLEKTCKSLTTSAETPQFLSSWLKPLYNMSEHQLRKVVWNVYSDDKHKVLYCAIAKAGCTSWKHHLIKNSDRFLNGSGQVTKSVHKERYLNKFGIVSLKKMKRSEIFERLDNYFSMITVRHPLDRLISAYNEKFVRETPYTIPYLKEYGIPAIKSYRNNPSWESLSTGAGLTFTEFLMMIRDQIKAKPLRLLDRHWESYFKSCFPCLIRYDYIAKLETSVSDIDYIIGRHLSGNNADIVMHNQRGGGKTFRDNAKVLRKYAEVPGQLFRDIMEYYQVDMDLFGYSAWRDVMGGAVNVKCGQTEGGCC